MEQIVAPWWQENLSLLGEGPMRLQLEVPAIDEVVKRLGLLLQWWALGVGVDFHDTEQGSVFRITIWD